MNCTRFSPVLMDGDSAVSVADLLGLLAVFGAVC